MQVQRIDNMFNFTYEKSAAEIVALASSKATALRSKIEEREQRITKVRAEYKITDAVLVDIMAKAREATKRGEAMLSYSTSLSSNNDTHEEESVTIGAGVVNMLLTERDHVEGERANVEKLDMIVRNLKDLRRYAPDGKEYRLGHALSGAELKFLGF